MSIKAVSTVIINNKNEVLLMLRDNKPGILNPDKWGLIGGHVEKDENFKKAAVREIKEETGLIINQDDLNEFITLKNPWRERHVFLLRGDWTDKDIIKGEGQKICFVKLEKAGTLDYPKGIDQQYIIAVLSEFLRNADNRRFTLIFAKGR